MSDYETLLEKYKRNELELAKYKSKVEKQETELIQLKRQNKFLEKQVYDLCLLLGEKIEFRNKLRRVMWKKN